jgi:hypothetical protein
VTRVATCGLTGLATVLLTAGPALADNPLGPSEGADPGTGLGPGATILLFVVLPLALVAAIFLVVWLPGAVRANRYRPTKGWTASPVWFAGPPDPVAAVQSAEVGDVVRGGASGSW